MDVDETTRERLAKADSLDVGGSPADTLATLCIYADDLDPEFVSATVKCPPTRTRRKGERCPDRPKIPPAPVGQWFLEAPDDLPFIERIRFLLDSTASAESVWRTLAESHRLELRTAIFLKSWTEGFELSSNMLAEIANRQWSFFLSMYSAEGEEILDAFLGRAKNEKNSNR